MAIPVVSIVIPTYNRASFLHEAIESALNQCYQSIEVLVIDDGSCDNTKEIVEPYIQKGRVKYYWQKNKGVSTARNKGINESTGQYIAFLDSDDLWMQNHLSNLMQVIQQFDVVDVVFSNFMFIGEYADAKFQNSVFNKSMPMLLRRGFTKQRNGVWLSNSSLLAALFEIGFSFRIQGSLVNKKLLLDNKISLTENVYYTEEFLFFVKMALHAKFSFLETPGVLIRRHDGNVDNKLYMETKVASYKVAIQELRNYFRGQLSRKQLQAFKSCLWQMQSVIMAERVRKRGFSAKVVEGIRLMVTVPSYLSLKSVIKMFIRK